MNYLKNNIIVLRTLTGLNQAEFGNLFGLNRDNIASYERGTEPKLKTLLSIVNYFHISIEQLVNEDLSKKIDSNSEINSLNQSLDKQKNQLSYTPTVITVDTQGSENIVFVPVKAAAGYLSGYADPEYIHKLSAYRMPGINNGVFRMFEISGNSMKETLENGDKIVGEWVSPIDIKNGNVYIIVSKNDGICVKRCINRLKSDNHLILQSDNEEFPDITINVEDILEVWNVKLRITSKVNSPSINRITENAKKLNDHSETLKRFSDLESRLAYTESRLSYTESRLFFIEQNSLNNP